MEITPTTGIMNWFRSLLTPKDVKVPVPEKIKTLSRMDELLVAFEVLSYDFVPGKEEIQREIVQKKHHFDTDYAGTQIDVESAEIALKQHQRFLDQQKRLRDQAKQRVDNTAREGGLSMSYLQQIHAFIY